MIFNKRALHVHPILIIYLFLKFLCSLCIKNDMTCNTAHLWLSHFELQQTINSKFLSNQLERTHNHKSNILKILPRKESFQCDHHEELPQDSLHCQLYALDDSMGGNRMSKEVEFL